MIIGACRIRLHLPESHSLKEKRKVVRSLVERLRSRFNLSVAEVDEQDRWQIAVLGLASASLDGAAAHALLSQAADFVSGEAGDFIVLDIETEIVPVF
jgi:uncharacterized protein YlxP (DUF503 family)